MIDSLSSLFKKEQPIKRVTRANHWFLRVNCTFARKKKRIRLKEFVVFSIFLTVFHFLYHFYAQELNGNFFSFPIANGSHRSSLRRYRSDSNNSLFRPFAHKKLAIPIKTKELIPNPEICYSQTKSMNRLKNNCTVYAFHCMTSHFISFLISFVKGQCTTRVY